jgi:hypothetical protein
MKMSNETNERIIGRGIVMKRMMTIVLTLILGLSTLAVPAVAEGLPQIDDTHEQTRFAA